MRQSSNEAQCVDVEDLFDRGEVDRFDLTRIGVDTSVEDEAVDSAVDDSEPLGDRRVVDDVHAHEGGTDRGRHV